MELKGDWLYIKGVGIFRVSQIEKIIFLDDGTLRLHHDEIAFHLPSEAPDKTLDELFDMLSTKNQE